MYCVCKCLRRRARWRPRACARCSARARCAAGSPPWAGEDRALVSTAEEAVMSALEGCPLGGCPLAAILRRLRKRSRCRPRSRARCSARSPPWAGEGGALAPIAEEPRGEMGEGGAAALLSTGGLEGEDWALLRCGEGGCWGGGGAAALWLVSALEACKLGGSTRFLGKLGMGGFLTPEDRAMEPGGGDTPG